MFLSVVLTNATMAHPVEGKKSDTTMNNRNNILNGSNVYNLRVKKWLCSEACESEYDYS
jgi:hypothetical protein